MYSMYSITY